MCHAGSNQTPQHVRPNRWVDHQLQSIAENALTQELVPPFPPLTSPINVILSDDSCILATGVGCISISMHTNGKSYPTILQDIHYVSELHRNLLSVSQLTC